MDVSPHERQQLELALFHLGNAHTAWRCRTGADMGEAERRLGVADQEEEPRLWSDPEYGATLDAGEAYASALGAASRLLLQADPAYYAPACSAGHAGIRRAVEARLAGRGRERVRAVR
jgi:hypothetical protein